MKEIQVEIVDIFGRLSSTMNLNVVEGDNEIRIDTRNMVKGVYFVKAGSIVQKVIVSKN